MGTVEPTVGEVTYIRYFESHFPRLFGSRTLTALVSDQPISHPGALVERIRIPLAELDIENVYPHLRTKDGAVVDSVTVTMRVAPDIGTPPTLANTQNCLVAYKSRDKTGKDTKEPEDLAKDWLRAKLHLELLSFLSRQKFRSLVTANTNGSAPDDATVEGNAGRISRLNSSVEDAGAPTKTASVQVATVDATTKTAVEDAGAPTMTLAAVLERLASVSLEKHGFRVVSNTCFVKCAYLDGELRAENPSHIPIIEYNNIYVDARNRLRELEKAHKEKEAEIQSSLNELDQKCEDLKAKHAIELERIKQEGNLEARKASIKAIADKQAAVEREKKLNELETQRQEERGPALKKLVEAKKQCADQEKQIRSLEMSEHADVLANQRKLMEERARLTQGIDRLPPTIDELEKLKALDLEKQKEKAKDDLARIGLARNDWIAQQEAERQSKVRREEAGALLLHRLLELQVLATGHATDDARRLALIQSVGEQLKGVAHEVPGMIKDLRIVSTSRAGDCTQSLLASLLELFETLNLPSLTDSLTEMGATWNGIPRPADVGRKPVDTTPAPSGKVPRTQDTRAHGGNASGGRVDGLTDDWEKVPG